MNFNKKIRQEAKLDSRRFGKGVVCKIVYGPLLEYLYQKSIIPSGVFINSNTGLDPMDRRMIVIPINKYRNILSLISNNEVSKENTESIENNSDLESIQNLTLSEEYKISYIKQAIVFVTISGSIPEGQLAGVDPNTYDVLIDSLDVNQAVEANYILTTKKIKRSKEIR